MTMIQIAIPPKAQCPCCMDMLTNRGILFYRGVAFCARCLTSHHAYEGDYIKIAIIVRSRMQPLHVSSRLGLLFFCPRITVTQPLHACTDAILRVLLLPTTFENVANDKLPT